MSDSMAANVGAYEQTVRSTLALARTLTAADWARPTECPGWTVKDQVSHLAGVERMLLGDPQPDHRLPADLPHVRNDFGRLMEVAVDARRGVPGPRVADELAAALERRLAELPGIDPARRVRCPDGNMGDYTRFMAFRALDCWTHEQDIRRAVDRPGNLDAPGAYCVWELLGGGLRTVVAARARARAGQSVAFTLTGPPSFARTVQIGDDGSAALVEEAVPTATAALAMSFEDYLRLTTGRCGPGDAAVDVSGDRDLAGRVLAGMALTP